MERNNIFLGLVSVLLIAVNSGCGPSFQEKFSNSIEELEKSPAEFDKLLLRQLGHYEQKHMGATRLLKAVFYKVSTSQLPEWNENMYDLRVYWVKGRQKVEELEVRTQDGRKTLTLRIPEEERRRNEEITASGVIASSLFLWHESNTPNIFLFEQRVKIGIKSENSAQHWINIDMVLRSDDNGKNNDISSFNADKAILNADGERNKNNPNNHQYGCANSVNNIYPDDMVTIPAGRFKMGDLFKEDNDFLSARPVHEVSTSSFMIDRCEITKEQWDEVSAWAQKNGYDITPEDGDGKGRKHPVYRVAWYETVKWCNARSERKGLSPCYYTNADKTKVYRKGEIDLTNDAVAWDAKGYRLPTEAEWEKAARGGARARRFPWGDTDTISHRRANYAADIGESYDLSGGEGFHPHYAVNGRPFTSPVGSFESGENGYGLYDMAGNVFEWCWDLFSNKYYSNTPVIDPKGPTGVECFRILRGGSWIGDAYGCRVANRFRLAPHASNECIGFRCVQK